MSCSPGGVMYGRVEVAYLAGSEMGPFEVLFIPVNQEYDYISQPKHAPQTMEELLSCLHGLGLTDSAISFLRSGVGSSFARYVKTLVPSARLTQFGLV